MGWSSEKNGVPLALAANQFEAFITVDKNLSYQQNLASLPLTVILLEARSIEWSELIALVPALDRALICLVPRSFIRVFGSGRSADLA